MAALGRRRGPAGRRSRATTSACSAIRNGGRSTSHISKALTAALAAAGVEGNLRSFHDLRHASLTNGAAAGESPIALMTRAGHANMSTTKQYLHLAGTVFRDEAARLEQRLLGGETFYPASTI